MQQLVQQALVGTARSEARAAADHAGHALLAGLELEPERRLLLLAGVASICDAAGWTAKPAPSLPAAAPTESRRVCSRALATQLGELFARLPADEAVVSEACELMHEAGLILPPEALPRALSIPNRKDLRSSVRKILGERGRWLAQFNPDWAWSRYFADSLPLSEELPADAETVFQEGEITARCDVLRLARRCNPTLARTWLTGVWSVEKADTRLKLLEAFSCALTLDDVPLLEQILKDRSAGVRKQAARALATIGGSPLAQRMIERAQSMIRFEAQARGGGLTSAIKSLVGGKPTAGKLTIELPRELPKDWVQDGVEAKPPQGVGERTFWLVQVISLVSPEVWSSLSKVDAKSFVELAAEAEHGESLIEGLCAAAVTFAAVEWQVALWDYGYSRLGQTRRTGDLNWVAVLQDLLAHMPAREAEGRLVQLLTTRSSVREWNLGGVLNSLPAPWSEAFGRGYLRWFWTVAESADQRAPEFQDWWSSASIAATALPVACFSEALKEPPAALDATSHRYWLDQLQKFQDVVRTRKRVREEIAAHAQRKESD